MPFHRSCALPDTPQTSDPTDHHPLHRARRFSRQHSDIDSIKRLFTSPFSMTLFITGLEIAGYPFLTFGPRRTCFILTAII